MKGVESVKLPDVLKRIATPRYILGTTYTLSLAFFESALFPKIDRSHLKSCLILCDSVGYQNALAEASALQGAAQDYMVVPAPVPGSFHAKVWLILGEDEGVLLTGSGNLTQAGFMTNAEFFDALHFTIENPLTTDLHSDIRSFLQGLTGMWQADDRRQLLCTEALSEMEQTFGRLAVSQESNGARFLHSFKGPLIDQIPDTPARELYVAAPFFGGSLRGLELLTRRHPDGRLNLFPAVHSGESTDIPLSEVRTSRSTARISQLEVASKQGAFAHLKLYGVACEDSTAWLFCASANCTEAAWQGPNVEAGLLRIVPKSWLATYFCPGNPEFPSNRLQAWRPVEGAGSFHIWATDTGTGLDLQIVADAKPSLPLRDVKIAIRAGSSLASCDRATLFQDGRFAHLPWSAFEGWQRRRKVALWLELQGRDGSGVEVRASVLVENRLLLCADPSHRSAWRGAQALLDAEGAPELADLAAIFSLAGDIFEGRLSPLPDTVQPGQTGPQEGNATSEPMVIAVWPPQPDSRELRKHIGPAAFGQLQWFQHILRAFLQNPVDTHTPAHAATVRSSESEAPDEQDHDESFTEQEVKLTEGRTAKKARQLWDLAYDHYSRVRDRLWELCPTASNAPNIWPAAVFTFLSTMATYRVATRSFPDLARNIGISAEMLCGDFFRAMFSTRRQHADFCCPRGFRYRSEQFPALAEDLHRCFKIRLHPELANVIVALIVDRRLRDPTIRPTLLWQKRQLELVCDASFLPGESTRQACRSVWRRLLCSASRKETDADFDLEFNRLFNLATAS